MDLSDLEAFARASKDAERWPSYAFGTLFAINSDSQQGIVLLGNCMSKIHIHAAVLRARADQLAALRTAPFQCPRTQVRASSAHIAALEMLETLREGFFAHFAEMFALRYGGLAKEPKDRLSEKELDQRLLSHLLENWGATREIAAFWLPHYESRAVSGLGTEIEWERGKLLAQSPREFGAPVANGSRVNSVVRAVTPPNAPPKDHIVSLGNACYRIGDHRPVSLSEGEDNVLRAFLETPVMTTAALIEVSGEKRAAEILRRLRQKHGEIFAPAIELPKRKSRGGYVVKISGEPTQAAGQPTP